MLIKYQGTCPKHAGSLARHILFPCSVKLQNYSLALPHEDTYTVAFLLSAARSSGLTTYTISCPFSKCRTESCPFHLSKVHLVQRVCFWLILCANLTATLWSFSGNSQVMWRSSPSVSCAAGACACPQSRCVGSGRQHFGCQTCHVHAGLIPPDAEAQKEPQQEHSSAVPGIRLSLRTSRHTGIIYLHRRCR